MKPSSLVLLTAFGAGLAGPALAQQPSPTPDPNPMVSAERPQAPRPDTAPRTVAVPAEPARGPRDSADAGLLKGARALALRSGEARLVVSGVERVVRPGDLIGTDTVKTITPERLVLVRADAAAPSASLVVVSFDAQGRARIRVYAASDTTVRALPEVK